MKEPYRKAMRTAKAIRRQIERRQTRTGAFESPDYEWSRLKSLQRLLYWARQRGWQGAAKRLHADLVEYLPAFGDSVNRLHSTLLGQRPVARLPCESELCRELLALEQEFDDVTSDPETGQVSVTVGPVILEDIHLGTFEIMLDWECSQPYRVVALDPNPAAANDSVTHPHVQGEQLCEGDGRVAIKAALAEGRLCDFFLLVSQILLTYGRGSAYVELDHWRGNPCAACGDHISEDDSYVCNACENTLCSECRDSCDDCGDSYCHDCLSSCAGCDERFCESCLRSCDDCGKPYCHTCLTNDLCEDCLDKRNDATEDDDKDASVANAASPAAAV